MHSIVIQIAAQSDDEFQGTLAKMRGMGLSVTRVLPRLKIVVGEVDGLWVRAKITMLPDVKFVEDEGLFQVGEPPERRS